MGWLRSLSVRSTRKRPTQRVVTLLDLGQKGETTLCESVTKRHRRPPIGYIVAGILGWVLLVAVVVVLSPAFLDDGETAGQTLFFLVLDFCSEDLCGAQRTESAAVIQ